MHRYNLNIVET